MKAVKLFFIIIVIMAPVTVMELFKSELSYINESPLDEIVVRLCSSVWRQISQLSMVESRNTVSVKLRT